MSSVTRLIAAFGALMATSLILAAPAVRLELARIPLPDGDSSRWSSTRCGVIERTPGHFEISSNEGCVRPAVGCRLPISRDWSHVRVSSTVRVTAAIPGDRPWDRPLVSLAWMDDSMAIVDYSPRPFPDAFGSTDLRRQSQLFAVPHDATAVVVRFVMAAASGSMHTDDISVAAFRARPGVAYAQSFVVMLWGILFTVTGRMLLADCRRGWLKPIIAILAILIVIGAIIPRRALPLWPRLQASASGTQESPGDDSAPAALGENTEAGAGAFNRALELGMDRSRFANFGHVLAFMVLALAIAAAGPRRRHAMIVAAVVAFAAATEVIQGFTPQRTPAFADFSLDLAGAAGALLMIAAISWFARRWGACRSG